MKKIYKFAAMLLMPAALLTATGCTNLDETLYDQVASQNYYNTKSDVVRAVFRPFEHAYYTIQSRQVLNEETADQLITPTREDWWDDGGRWARLHRHKWITTNGEAQSQYNLGFQGIGQTNLVIEDLDKLQASKFGFTDSEFNNLKAQNRVLRAWFYLTLLDEFRNIPFTVSYYDQSKNTLEQVEPRKIYDFIESELKESLPMLTKKTALGGNQNLEGQWTQAGAAALLVRLYLNAKVYIGEDHFADCEKVAQDILDGKYGTYKVADRWDAAFDWNNETCDEVIFAFPELPAIPTGTIKATPTGGQCLPRPASGFTTRRTRRATITSNIPVRRATAPMVRNTTMNLVCPSPDSRIIRQMSALSSTRILGTASVRVCLSTERLPIPMRMTTRPSI